MTQLVRSVSQATTVAIAGGTPGTKFAHRAFGTTRQTGIPGAAKAGGQTGALRMVYRRGTQESSCDGSVCSIVSIDGGVTWGTEQTIIDGTLTGGTVPMLNGTPLHPLPNGYRPGVRDIHFRQGASGRLHLAFAQHAYGDLGIYPSFIPTSGTFPSNSHWYAWYIYSDDNGATWSTPEEITFTGTGAPSFPYGCFLDDIIELPNGNIVASAYCLNTIGTKWDAHCARLDVVNGTGWSYAGHISGTISGYNAVETSLAILPDTNTIYATFHTENGVPSGMYRTTSTDEGITWALPALVQTKTGNRHECWVSADGDMLWVFANYTGSDYGDQAFQQSWDNGVTFSTPTRFQTFPSGMGRPAWASACDIASAGASPNIGLTTAYELADQTQANLYWTTLTRGSDGPPAPPVTPVVMTPVGGATRGRVYLFHGLNPYDPATFVTTTPFSDLANGLVSQGWQVVAVGVPYDGASIIGDSQAAFVADGAHGANYRAGSTRLFNKTRAYVNATYGTPVGGSDVLMGISWGGLQVELIASLNPVNVRAYAMHVPASCPPYMTAFLGDDLTRLHPSPLSLPATPAVWISYSTTDLGVGYLDTYGCPGTKTIADTWTGINPDVTIRGGVGDTYYINLGHNTTSTTNTDMLAWAANLSVPGSAAVGRSANQPFSIKELAGRSLAQPWNDQNRTARSCSMPFEVQAVHAGKSLNTPYAMRNAVGHYIIAAYVIDLAVGDSLEFSYSIPTISVTYSTDRRMGPPQVLYNTRRDVAVGASFPVYRHLQMDYQISPPVSAPIVMPYKINAVTSKSLQQYFDVLNIVGHSIDIGYKIAIARSLDQTYLIYRFQGHSLVMPWSDTGIVGHSTQLPFDIGTNPLEFQMPVRLPARTKARR